MQRILEQWEPLKSFFDAQWLEHRLNASENIHISLNDPSVKIFFNFLQWVLPKFTSANALYQSEKVLITTLHERMSSLYKDLLLSFMERNYVLQTNLQDIDPNDKSKWLKLNNMYLGLSVQQYKEKLKKEELEDFLVRVSQFLLVACMEIKKRYNFNDPLLSRMNTISPTCKRKPDSLIDLFKHVPRILDMTNDVKNAQLVDSQWRSLITSNDIPNDIKQETDVEKYWTQILQLKNLEDSHVYKELALFVLDLLSCN